jgi:hypothetical protein
VLVEANSTLEGELKKVGASKTLLDNYRSQIEALERKSNDQASEVGGPFHVLDVSLADESVCGTQCPARGDAGAALGYGARARA